MDDLDYETKFLYRVPERRLSHSKYSRRIQHGIRNDADGERTTKRVATQYENEQRRSVKTDSLVSASSLIFSAHFHTVLLLF